MLVKLKGVRLQRPRDFGDVWLALGLDRLLVHNQALEQLQERLGDRFARDYNLLDDVSSTYFDGECRRNPMAKRGYSRDSRPGCLQVCIRLVVTTDGIALADEVFDDNSTDSKTVETIVPVMEAKYGRANRMCVMDRVMVSEDNLNFLRQRGGSDILGTPRAMLRRFEQQLTDEEWVESQAGVELKLLFGPNGDETFALARNAERLPRLSSSPVAQVNKQPARAQIETFSAIHALLFQPWNKRYFAIYSSVLEVDRV